MTAGRARDDELIGRRLAVWSALAPQGVRVDDIAARLGMSRAALDQLIHRERASGNPAAVYHLNGHPRVPDGDRSLPTRLRNRRERERRRRHRLARAATLRT